MPVVCSPAAARIVADMGFKNVFELEHGQSMTFCNGAIHIQATVEPALVLQHDDQYVSRLDHSTHVTFALLLKH